MRKSLHCLIHLSASLYLSPADCFKEILFEQWGTSCWNKLPFAAGGGHLRECFNVSHFLLTRMQFSTWTRFPNERCRTRTERSVSVGRYQTETRWCSFFVKSHVGALSLEPSDISMLHNSHNRCTLLYHHYSPTHLSTSFTWKPGQGFRPQVTPSVWFWSKAVEGFPEVKHCTGPYLWILPAAFEPGSWKFRYCFFSKVITTTSFMIFCRYSTLEVSPP